jgi:hypothetical protein
MTNNFNTVPNQRVFVIHREDKGGNFIAINKLNYSKAYRDMSKAPAALGLYIWLVGNQDKYQFAFSPQAIENQLGMATNSCHGAVKRLIELGYLVQRNENSNQYDFYEVSVLDGKLERKRLVSEEMINFEDLLDESEEEKSEIPFPIKPGKFEF